MARYAQRRHGTRQDPKKVRYHTSLAVWVSASAAGDSSPTSAHPTVRPHVKAAVRRALINVRIGHCFEAVALPVDISVHMTCRDVAQPSRTNRTMQMSTGIHVRHRVSYSR